MKWSFTRAHETGGYGSWANTKSGERATLDYLRPTEVASFGKDWARMTWMNTIHQTGGTVKTSEKQRGYFWYKFIESDRTDDKWKWMALSKTMFYPVRAMELQEEDKEYFKQQLLDTIFSIKQTVEEVEVPWYQGWIR
jgi:hypothetical protein